MRWFFTERGIPSQISTEFANLYRLKSKPTWQVEGNLIDNADFGTSGGILPLFDNGSDIAGAYFQIFMGSSVGGTIILSVSNNATDIIAQFYLALGMNSYIFYFDPESSLYQTISATVSANVGLTISVGTTLRLPI